MSSYLKLQNRARVFEIKYVPKYNDNPIDIELFVISLKKLLPTHSNFHDHLDGIHFDNKPRDLNVSSYLAHCAFT